MDWSSISAADFANGVLFLIGAAVAALGGIFGRKQKQKDAGGEPLELAGAVIDQKQAEAILTVTVANTEALEDNTRAVHQSRRETVHALECLDREIQNLRQEIISFRRE